MKALLILATVTLAGSSPKVDRLKATIESQRIRIERQQEALELSRTAHCLVLARWSLHGGLMGDPEQVAAWVALQAIEGVRP